MKKFFSLFFFVLIFPFCHAYAAPPKIYMVMWNGCEEACQGFLDYLKASRFNVKVIQRNLNKKTDKIPELIKEAKEMSPDLLVTWGSLATLKMLGTQDNGFVSKSGSIPALFMVVSQPVESGLVPSLISQGRNITGVMHLVPLAEQLQLARQIIPFKRLGTIYNPSETNAQVVVDQLARYAKMMSFELLDYPLPLNKDGKPDAKEIESLVNEMASQKVELIYLGPDAFMNANRTTLINAATAVSIPVFSASEGAVRNDNALFAFVHRYYTVGQMAGKKALKILKDKVQAYDIPIEAPQRALLVVNMTAARNTGVYPALLLMQNADLVNIPDRRDSSD